VERTETLSRNVYCPFIAKPFTVYMEMRSRYLFAVRISVRSTSQIEPDKYYCLPSSVLHLYFEQVDSAPTNIE